MLPLRMDDTFISPQSLMRCCVETLVYIAEQEPFRVFGDGETVTCRFSRGNSLHKMVLFHGRWQWVRPVESEMEQRDILLAQKHRSVRSIGDA